VSGRNARNRRRAVLDRELVAQAHSALHSDDVDLAHELLHGALGVDNSVGMAIAPLAPHAQFDEEFRALCIRLGVVAAYVAAEPTSTAGRVRLLSGGNADLCAQVGGWHQAAKADR